MLDWNKAMQELKTKPLQPIYTCVGSEFVLVEAWVDALSNALSKQAQVDVETVQFSFDDGGLEEALLSCQSLSLFTSTQIVKLTDFWAATTAKGSSKAKYSTESLEKYLDNPVPENVLVITVSADKLDERKKLVKKLKQFPVVDCTTPKEAAARKMLQSLIGRNKIQISDDALTELWRRSQTVSRSITEAHKLWTFTAGQQVGYDDVCQLVAAPAEDNIFDWIDGVVTGNADKSYRALSDLVRSGQDTFSLFGMMVRQLRLMWYARTLGSQGYSAPQIASEAGAHPYAVQVAERQSANLRPTDIETLLTIVADAEFAVKSGRRDTEQALDWVVASCLAKLRRRPSRFPSGRQGQQRSS